MTEVMAKQQVSNNKEGSKVKAQGLLFAFKLIPSNSQSKRKCS